MRRRTRHCCLAAAALCAALGARAQEDVALDENVTWAASARSETIPDSIDLSIFEADAGGESMVVPLRRLSFSLGEPAVELEQLRTYRFESADAIRDFGNVLTYYDAASDTVRIETALVVDADGEVHTIDPATVQILSSDTLSVFGDTRVVVIPLPGLEIGATAIVADTITTKRAASAPWGAVVSEQYGVPQERLEISVRWPSPEARPAWHSGLKTMRCSESDAGSLSCVAVDIPAYPIDENAYYDDIVPQFAVAEQRTWDDIRDWYEPLFESALTGGDTIRETAERLVEGADTDVEKLRAIHRFVATQVRYVGLEHGESAFVPHATAMTLARRYGDCKDKTALLVDLLEQVGIEMSPVLVSTTRREPGKIAVPARNYFDHLIACGTLADGRSYCLDATDPYTGIDFLSGGIQGAVSLHVDGSAGLSTLPAARHAWIVNEGLRLGIRANGAVLERSSVEYAGDYGTRLRAALAGLSSSERQRWALEDYHSAVSTLVDPDFEFAGLDDIDAGLTVSWTTSFEGLVQPANDLDYVEAMSWLNQVLDALATRNEAFSYRFAGLQFDSTATIELDDIWRIDSTGPDIDMQTEFGMFRRSYARGAQSVEIRTQFSAPAAVIPVDRIPAFNRFLEIVREEGYLRVRGKRQ